MKVTYYTGIRNLEPKSMEVYRTNLIRELKKIDPHLYLHEDQWFSPTDFNIPHFHFDREFYRYILYSISASKHYDEINHVLDHTYAGVFNFLPKVAKKIVTVHDLFQLGSRINSFRLISVPGIMKADKIIADSQTTKNELIKLLKIKRDKIKVVYQGVNMNIFKPLKNSKKRRFTNKIIILNVANNEKRKNTILIIKSFYRLIEKFPNIVLVRVGSENKETLTLIKKLKLEKRVFYFENILEERLVELYNIADLFVFPSLYEGFGLPPLEAMACGCPVITSNISSLQEVVGDAGIMVNPTNVDTLTRMIERVLINENFRKEIIIKGLKQVKKFSWEKIAEETLKIYREVANQ